MLLEKFTEADVEHIAEETLESYAMGNLHGRPAVEVEEHLFFCDLCREKLSEETTFSRSTKTAAPMLPVERERSWWKWRVLAPAFAACAVLITLVAVKFPPNGASRVPVAVSLYAMRGPSAEAHAPAGRPLVLRPDLGGLREAAQYDVEVVNSTGGRVWHGVAKLEGETATVPIPAQEKGVYFVRIILSGEPLREYALVLSPGN